MIGHAGIKSLIRLLVPQPLVDVRFEHDDRAKRLIRLIRRRRQLLCRSGRTLKIRGVRSRLRVHARISRRRPSIWRHNSATHRIRRGNCGNTSLSGTWSHSHNTRLIADRNTCGSHQSKAADNEGGRSKNSCGFHRLFRSSRAENVCRIYRQ